MFNSLKIKTAGTIFIVLLFLTGMVLIFSSLNINNNINAISTSWNSFQKNYSARGRLLNMLRSEMGFGGMIHQFKNYILRRDLKYVVRAQARMGGMLASIREYETLDLNVQEMKALGVIRESIDAYSLALKKAVELSKNNISSEKLDKIIKIDDSRTFRALDVLLQASVNHNSNKKVVNKTQLITLLNVELGYGGLIHEFKNYVLRGDQRQLPKVRKHLTQARDILFRYNKTGINENETRAISDIISVIDAYKAGLVKAEDLTSKNIRGEKIDSLVKVNDAPALEGIVTLKKAIVNYNKTEEEQVDRLLISASSLVSISMWITITIIIFLVLLSMLLIHYKIVKPLYKMTRSMKSLANNELDTEIPDSGKSTELGAMATALQVFKDNVIRAEKLAEEKQKEERIKEERQNFVEVSTGQLNKVIDAVAKGDLTQRAEITGEDTDELVQMGINLNRMIESLNDITVEINDATANTASSLTEVQSALTAQSSSATEQAAAVSETMSTLEEIKATSNQTLDKVSSLGEIAEQSRKESEHGLLIIDETVSGMELINQKVEAIAASILELSKKNQQIGEITSVVEGLAHQSKMLALNASIEAAKAGEAGQGFAVVAEEIRNLANQSTESTAQVKAILQDIQSFTEKTVMVTEEGTKQVSKGVVQVESAGTTMATLNEVVKQASISSQQIIAVVRQEAVGINQINIAMKDISTSTNNMVSAVRQTEKAMVDLNDIADALKNKVSIYHI
ncbi:MAG: HAMP domain-containing protein [Proteobacteria bacterium]|nr:HAMP domain-containing protein [Pseudomonadota bacterium]